MKVSQKNCDFFLATGPESTSLAAWYLTSHWNIFIEEEEGLVNFPNHDPAALAEAQVIEAEMSFSSNDS